MSKGNVTRICVALSVLLISAVWAAVHWWLGLAFLTLFSLMAIAVEFGE